MDRITIRKASELTGYTEKAIRAKIERGVWPEGLVWFRAPDGRILVSQRGYEEWVGGRESERSGAASRWTSATRASGAGRGSG